MAGGDAALRRPVGAARRPYLSQPAVTDPLHFVAFFSFLLFGCGAYCASMKSRLKEVFVICCALVLKANAQTPLIISQPQSITVNNASAAAFTVVASNAATYQWQFQGTTNLPGATNATLSLDDVSTNQAGSYTVVVTSSNNLSVTSSPPAVLTIVPGTIIQWTISTYPNGSSSNFLVQLFDHDKPATVQNFIHYITSGSYSNTFFDRDVTNFVLQGGDYVTDDRTTNSLHGGPVSTGTNIFPAQVDNEFSVGPLIHNRFGTLAMALAFGDTNITSGAFFFNLADNSTNVGNLDSQDFTVFGRILTGTNILQYFNTLSAPSNGIFDLESSIPTLPVNYDGTNEPTDANLFYCDFNFQTPPPVVITPPTVSITFPAPNAVFTNSGDLTATGTAAAATNAGVAEVFCVLTPLTGPNDGESQTNAAVGTSDWSLDLGTNPPGVYQLSAYAQDGAGNLSAPATEYFTNLAMLTIITNAEGQLTTNEQFLTPGQTYSVTAAPLAGEQFLNWQNQGVVSIDPVQTFTAETNFTLTVTFVLTNLPPGLAITSPAANSVVLATNAELTISGTLPSSVTVTELTVQLFIQSNAVTAALPAVINGANWSLTENNLTGAAYTVVVVAEDSLGQEGLVTENFTALAPPIIISQPTNVTILSNSTAVFSVTALNVVSYQWQLVGTGPIAGATNATLVLPNVSTNSSYDVVLTSPDGESVTSAPALLTVVPGTLVQITFSGFPDGSSSNVVVQLFDHEKPATVANFLHYITPVVESGPITNVAFSNMIWDMCIPGFILQGGDYDATDQTNSTPPPHLESINENFTENLSYSPPFPFNIDNEFGVGPLIHNTFGTLAMAKSAGNPDSASNAFFFNLADNSSNLDNENGGYTVFGQVISNASVLQYFNTLKKPDQGIFDNTTATPYGTLPDLPVNYHGWNLPANSNLFFANFTLLSTFNADTNPPAVVLNYPTNGQTITNVDLVFQGTASDNVGVARVVCAIGEFDVIAVGTTNWTADFGTVLPPGTYRYRVVAQDGSGNITPSTSAATGTLVVPRFPFEASTNGNGTLSTNLNGTVANVGARSTITAKPGKDTVFVNWVMGTNTFLSPTTNFIMQNGLQMTANFLSNPVIGGISFTYPLDGVELTNSSFSIKGKVSTRVGPAQVTCQVFSASTGNSISGPMLLSASNTWSTGTLSFAPGEYIVQAIAQGTNGRVAVASEPFMVMAQLTVIKYGSGSASIPNGAFLRPGSDFLIRATPEAGNSFLSWNAGFGSTPLSSITFTMSAGLTLTATFVSNTLPNKLTFTAPSTAAQLTTKNVMLEGKIASSVVAPQVLCQLFISGSPLTGFMLATVSATGTSWTLPVTNLGMGAYTAVALATDATGKTTLASREFSVNFYPLLAGHYHGLFFDPTSVSGTNAGSVSFSLGDTGIVNGNLTFPRQKSYLLDFQMGASGSASYQAPGFTVPIDLTFNFDFTNFTAEMTGTISQGSEVCRLAAYRAVTKLSTNTTPSPATYVLNLEPVPPASGILTGPPGDSFTTVIVSAGGNLAIAGTLADETTPFSFSTGVFTNGVWPMYASFFKGNEMLIGWETNLPSGVCTGTLYWFKSPTNGIVNGLYDTNGISEQLNSFGAKYVAPKPGTNYQIVFGGGTLESLVTNVCSFKNGAIVPAAGTTNKLTGTLSSMGVLKGSILNPFNDEKLPFSGAFINPTNGGAGFTLDTNRQTGYFGIGLAP
jgi:cyclophilin family peptidyl-prolyl cis-trans isomerase